MPYDPTSARGRARAEASRREAQDPTSARGALAGDQARLRADALRSGQNFGLRQEWSGRIVGPGGVPVGETRLDINKPLPEFGGEFAPESETLKTRRAQPGWGMRLFGYAFAWICAIGFLGVLSITIAYGLDRYYNELFNK